MLKDGVLSLLVDIAEGDVETRLVSIQEEHKPDVVVVERSMPYKASQLGRRLHAVHAVIATLFPEAIWIDPVEWKSNKPEYKRIRRLTRGAGLSEHRKDAYAIAVWALPRIRSTLPVPESLV